MTFFAAGDFQRQVAPHGGRIVKALSVKQLWANLIAAGEKTIETRTWVTAYRGPLLIVSAKRPRIEPAGFAVAVVTLTGCRPMTRKDEKAACCRLYPRAHAWMLTDITRIEPIPVKGSLGIFDCALEPEDLYVER
ncbi:MAG: ASCH domain-containing protein [Gammaproteobacteria bacterium]